MPTNDKLIAHGRIGLALKIIKQQSTMDIIIDNTQTGGRVLNDDKIRERRASRERRERSKPERQQQQISDADDDANRCFSNWRERGWRYG
jgi:hypothetical protein